MKVYLAGSVPKGDKEARGFEDWRETYRAILAQHWAADFIDPYTREADERDALLVTGLDCRHIKASDLVVVNAEDKLGAGTALELAVAKYFHKPVVTVLPKNSHHRRANVHFHSQLVEDWIHPFIHTFSDYIVEDVIDIADLKIDWVQTPRKNLTIIDEAIAHAEQVVAKSQAATKD